MDLSGTWRATAADEQLRRTFSDPDHDDESWSEVAVPGHWAGVAELAGAESVLHRRRFEGPDPDAEGGEDDGLDPGPPPNRRRWWLSVEGICQQGDVWLDGAYLGATDGYFVPHLLEVTDQIRAGREHVLAVEATSRRFGDPDDRAVLTGALQDPELCGSADLVPGGLWRPLRLRPTGEIAITHSRVVCAGAGPARARLALRAVLDVPGGGPVELRTRVAGAEHVYTHPAAAGENRVEWTVEVDDPELWWPHSLGSQPLHRGTVEAMSRGTVHDVRRFRIGFRSVAVRNWVMSVNGERLFLKGANLLPTRPLLADASGGEVAADVEAARAAGLDMVRPVAHVARPELYDAADELGMLIWQDLPLRGVMSRAVGDQARRQAREAVDLLGCHPSVAVWCAHDEPLPRPDRPGPAPPRIGPVRPSWNRAVLDRSLSRVLNRCDGSRPVVAHTAAGRRRTGDGATSHLWFGRHGGRAADLGPALARRPQLGRFITAFGAPSNPLDPPSAAAQAEVVKTTVETLRRLMYHPTGGFLLQALADIPPDTSLDTTSTTSPDNSSADGSTTSPGDSPAASPGDGSTTSPGDSPADSSADSSKTDPGGGMGVLDHRRQPKPAWDALVDACRDLIVVSDPLPDPIRPNDRLDLAIHVVSQLRQPIEDAVVTARLTSANQTAADQRWTGEITPDACTFIGRITATAPTNPGPLTLELELTYEDNGQPVTATNHYQATINPPG